VRTILKKYFLSGLIVWLPIWVTVLILGFVINVFDSSLNLLPKTWQPHTWLGFDVPGLGFVLSVVIVFITGILASNFFGRRLVEYWDAMLQRIPLVRSVYSASKQAIETVLSKKGQSFRKVYLIEYPRKGIWTLAFQTADVSDQLTTALDHAAPMIMVYVPTTPNPTSGFLLLVPQSELRDANLTVDEALRLVISLGVVQPQQQQQQQRETYHE